jgi:hypothetical protein
LREDSAELRFVRRARSRLYLDQIRPHGLMPFAMLRALTFAKVMAEQDAKERRALHGNQ